MASVCACGPAGMLAVTMPAVEITAAASVSVMVMGGQPSSAMVVPLCARAVHVVREGGAHERSRKSVGGGDGGAGVGAG